MQVAERAGVHLETGCNTGSCGICEVEHPHACHFPLLEEKEGLHPSVYSSKHSILGPIPLGLGCLQCMII